jgi:hypothetical protein
VQRPNRVGWISNAKTDEDTVIDAPKMKPLFTLIVAIIGAGLWQRYSLYPSYGWTVPLSVAAVYFIYHAKRGWHGDRKSFGP